MISDESRNAFLSKVGRVICKSQQMIEMWQILLYWIICINYVLVIYRCRKNVTKCTKAFKMIKLENSQIAYDGDSKGGGVGNETNDCNFSKNRTKVAHIF